MLTVKLLFVAIASAILVALFRPWQFRLQPLRAHRISHARDAGGVQGTSNEQLKPEPEVLAPQNENDPMSVPNDKVDQASWESFPASDAPPWRGRA